jgi:pimeloyl-ACP methyl ester carboxylesterase
MRMHPAPVPVRLPTSVWGVGQPRRALLVHGLASSGPGWWRVASALADAGFEVTAPDLRGHGGAPPSPSLRFADFAADLALLGPEWDLVIGHSLGGPIVATLLRTGVAARRLVLLDPVFHIDPDDHEAVVADQVAEADAFADPVAIGAANPRWHADDAFHKARAARQVSPATVEQVCRQNAPWDHADLLVGLGSPCAVLGADPVVSCLFTPELAARLTAADPDITYELVAGAGHSIHRERPDAVIAAALASVH